MVIARSRIINPAQPGWYHCISRCVRRAYLCGQDFSSGHDYDHRRGWIRDRLRFLAGVFAVDVAGYAVMSNHLHVVVRVDPEKPLHWSDREVVERWLSIFPSRYLADGTPLDPTPEQVQIRLEDSDYVQRARQRLGSISWFMRCLKEPIARRANKEDECTGAFWEGRFTSVALLDEAAIITCMAYVDLNPIRAGLAATPEESEHTSIQERLQARAARSAPGAQGRDRWPPPRHSGGLDQRTEGEASWLLPLSRCGRQLDEDWYFKLVDRTGRLARPQKSGVMAADLPEILARMQIDAKRWSETMSAGGQIRGTALGHAAARMREALRRGSRWLSSHCPVFAGQRLLDTEN